MNNAPARDLEWLTRLSASRLSASRLSAPRLSKQWAIVSSLLLGALFTCFPAHIRAADPFAPGNVTGSIYVGAGRALDQNYTTFGGMLGYMVSEGLMLGASAELWSGNDPTIYKLTPEVRYTFTDVAPVKPYVGAFVSRTIYDGPSDRNTYGVRGGIYRRFSSNAAFNVGVVYEKISSCDTATYGECSQFYPEVGILFSF